MTEEKDVRFSDKRVDESWKDNASREKSTSSPSRQGSSQKEQSPSSQKTSKAFINLITSLGLQALMHLGEMPHPETQTQEVNLQAAREIIDLLSMLKDKTEGNRSSEEDQILNSLIPELQMKFSQKA